jgi:phage gpG-like protein
MNHNDFFTNLLKDIKTDLKDEFDRNFERKAFFNEPWADTKMHNNRGSLMMRSGDLRKSIGASIDYGGGKILFTSSLPYASIHNEGGIIIVTAQMKKYFWFRHMQAKGATQVFNIKSQKQVNTKRTKMLSSEADFWKAMALKKVGDKITITKRQFIGNHQNVKNIVKQDIDNAVQAMGKQLQIQMIKNK